MSRRCLGCMELFGDDFEICPHCGYIVGTHAEEAIHMEPGTILHDRYIIGKILGYGGFGITYIGWDGKLEQKVAIKEYLPGEFSTRMPGQSQVTVFNGEKSEQFHDGMKKFIDEAKRLAKFQNEPGIVKIFDSFEENETAYIIMEYLDGETLTDYLKREKTIPEDQAVNMLMPVMNSLQTVHAEGLLHRDIAPDNIFLTKNGDVKLIDFGASRYATTSHSRSLTVIIKPGYSPEEQYRSRGDQGPYTDVYAIAATLYKMITGKTPPDAMERRAKYENQNKDILEEPHKLNKDISVNREVAILNAMNVRIEDRTPDVAAFLNELNADPPAKRRYGKIKKIDVYSWPLWLKILVPTVLVAVVTFGTLLLTGVINFSHYNKEAVIPDNVVITPDVEGMQKDDAMSAIEKEQLLGVIGESIESEYIAAGKIIIQTPVGGAFLEKNGTVMLSVSSGNGVKKAENGIATVPYLIGDTEDGAKEKLKEAGLGDAIVEYEYSDTIAANRVVSQSEEYGTEVEEGTQITIVISKGSKAFKMIKVVGMEADEAVKKLTDLGLAVDVSYEEGDANDENKVIKQDPDDGEDVTKGTKVKIVICTKSSVITVPDVEGKTKSEAEEIINDKKLNVKASEDYSDSVPEGTVIRQTPKAGEGAKEGDTVVIVISKGARPAETTRTTQQTTKQTTKKTTKQTTKQTSATKVTTEQTEKKEIKPERIELNNNSITLDIGDSRTISATVYPSNADDKSVTWTSSNSSIASVTNGTIRAIKGGTVSIYARTANGKSATCTVKVNDVWHEVDSLPSGVNSSSYEIQYKHTYETVASSSPGSDWSYYSFDHTEYVNSGSQYRSPKPLSTSNTRVLVSDSRYYHWCNPSRYEDCDFNYSSKYCHFDIIDGTHLYVYRSYTDKDDSSVTYYYMKWSDGNNCRCIGSQESWGGTCGEPHSARCYYWYREYLYQDKAAVNYNKYRKTSSWVSSRDYSAKSVRYRYKLK